MNVCPCRPGALFSGFLVHRSPSSLLKEKKERNEGNHKNSFRGPPWEVTRPLTNANVCFVARSFPPRWGTLGPGPSSPPVAFSPILEFELRPLNRVLSFPVQTLPNELLHGVMRSSWAAGPEAICLFTFSKAYTCLRPSWQTLHLGTDCSPELRVIRSLHSMSGLCNQPTEPQSYK